jgi:hypothetical protein
MSENECKGLFFKYIVNDYHSDFSLIKKQTLRFLKRKSCKGCPFCDFIKNDMGESFGYFYFPKSGKHGDVYRIVNITDNTDFETGHVDEWHYEFVKVDEE